jgi:hypothetical protein
LSNGLEKGLNDLFFCDFVIHLKELYIKQNGLCAICFKECSSGKRLAVDHNHISGKIRGLLCSNCNTSLGGFMDNEKLLINVVEYLRKYN